MRQFTVRCLLKYSTQPRVTSHKNPYLSIPLQSLKEILERELHSKQATIPHINSLLSIGMALHHNPLHHTNGLLEESILRKCMQGLEELHHNIEVQEENQLAQLEFAWLLKLLATCTESSSCKLAPTGFIEKLSMLYANTYSHILALPKQLEVYDQSHQQHLDFIQSVSLDRISDLKKRQLPLSTYIGLLRRFYTRMTSEEINSELQQYVRTPSLCDQLSETEKLTLLYILICANGDLTVVGKLQLEPLLTIKSTEDPKDVCLKLEILKHRAQHYGDLCHLELDRWDYAHLVWVSQFVDSQSFANRLHSAIMKKQLPASAQPSSILSYATNASIDLGKHKQVSDWLCRQNLSPKQEDSLCSMLKQMDGKGWVACYEPFYRLVLRMSLGSFKWENQNVIYYLGQVHGIEDENLEYLRRYILNTYASLGTARREVPTDSYFYKILEVTEVEKFYGNL